MSDIIGPLPNEIAAGQLADAGPVMANFDFIRTQVNANAAGGGVASTLVLIGWQTGQSVPSNFGNVLGYAFSPTIIFDQLGEFDPVLGEFTAQNDGGYLIQAYVRLASTMTGISFGGTGPIIFYKNLTTAIQVVGDGGIYANGYGVTSDIRAFGSTVVNLLAGDTIQTYFYSPLYTGGALHTSVFPGSINTQYSISRIN